MKKMNVSNLLGSDLNNAVAITQGGLHQAESARPSFWMWPGPPVCYSSEAPRYSSDPAADAQGLFEANKISILWRPELNEWWACCDGQDPTDEDVMGQFGPTQLIAGLRCLVQARLCTKEDDDYVLLPS